ncbi:MAG: DUF445 family protein [Turicibacter sp.]|nr:DUF445 family protein [Turicibacter sp.]
MTLSMIITPIIGAIIGYSTNYLAIKMLFRPLRPVYIGKFKLPFTPGLIPKEQSRLAKKLGEAMGNHVITSDVLAKELFASPLLEKSAEEVKILVRKHLPRGAEFIRYFNVEKLDKDGPDLVKRLINEHVGKFAGIFLDSEKIYVSIKDGIFEFLSEESNLSMIADKIDENIDKFIEGIDAENAAILPETKQKILLGFEKVAEHVAKYLDITSIIERRINEFDPLEAETLILSVIKRELNMVMMLGGVLGFIIGLVPLFV